MNGQPRESFLPGDPGKILIQLGPFEIFTCRCRFEIRPGIFDHAGRVGCRNLSVAAFQIIKKDFGMFLFIFRRLGEDIGDLLEAFFAGGAGEIGVTVAGLGLSREGSQQIFLGLSSFNS